MPSGGGGGGGGSRPETKGHAVCLLQGLITGCWTRNGAASSPADDGAIEAEQRQRFDRRSD